MKSAFAAAVGTLSPAGKSRSGATDGAANQSVWSARAKGCLGVPLEWIMLDLSIPANARVASTKSTDRPQAAPAQD